MSAIACYIPHFQDLFKPGLLNFLWDTSFSIKVLQMFFVTEKETKTFEILHRILGVS